MTDESWPGAVFERLYETDPDPWGFESSDYERAKYAETLAALDGRRFRFVLELGCSIGVMTAALAPCCDRLLGIDIAETALARARERCAGIDHVAFQRAWLPDRFPDLPEGSCDLVLISELLYFLSPEDNARLAEQVMRVLAPGGLVLLVNWTGETNTPCTGDQAAELFAARCIEAERGPVTSARHEGYRLDRIAG